jgi:DNA (cytosine-5)-methyltransferase 1
MRAGDLFSGAGGGSLGLERLGINVVFGVDIDDKAVETYEKNLNSKAIKADLTETSLDEIVQQAGENDIDMLIGCPPCQNFSSLRDTTPWNEDEPKDLLLQKYLERIEEKKPKYVIFENVRGILNTDNGVHIDTFIERMEDDLNYKVIWDIVNTKNFGVPQDRERVIAFGVHDYDEELEFPEATYEEVRYVEDAIGDLPSLSAGEESDEYNWHEATNHQEKTLERIKDIPKNGGDRTDLRPELKLECHKNMDITGAENVYGRMSWEKPAPTITTRCTNPSSGRFVHPEDHRGITVREAARLQTFPDDFDLPNTKKHASKLIGNAVPPKLIEEIVREFFKINDLEELPEVKSAKISHP